ncbi:melatonin receptor type 1A-like [Sphaerodactylus townsendi]|uniref:melatonin receptor type 1A-like n=1 Tax=Sphaerodactylus townsendi TaxID=933632 RepID=UPI002026DAB3|nr:melatonin receptor type 1A-like [Sphaerodactylus townsendi]
MRAGNRTVPDGPRQPDSDRPPWVATALAAILIFTIVVDILGNLLVILSVYRNKKLRNAGLPTPHWKKSWRFEDEASA